MRVSPAVVVEITHIEQPGVADREFGQSGRPVAVVLAGGEVFEHEADGPHGLPLPGATGGGYDTVHVLPRGHAYDRCVVEEVLQVEDTFELARPALPHFDIGVAEIPLPGGEEALAIESAPGGEVGVDLHPVLAAPARAGSEVPEPVGLEAALAAELRRIDVDVARQEVVLFGEGGDVVDGGDGHELLVALVLEVHVVERAVGGREALVPARPRRVE